METLRAIGAHRRLRVRAAAGTWLLVAAVVLSAGAEAPALWPARVPGWQAPGPGEHPRLFFRTNDLPALRARAKTAEGQALLARLRTLLGGGDAMPARFSSQTRAYERNEPNPEGAYSISHAAGFGFLYQLTGDRHYADLGRQCFEKAWAGARDCDPEARYAWVAPGGCLRAGPTLGWYALGYDLCFDGWDEDFRRRAAAALQDYNQRESGQGAEGKGEAITLERLARYPKHPPDSNHWGPQIGGAALALLAIRGDPGTDDAKTSAWLAAVEKNLAHQMTNGWGDHGWFAEGDGPGAVSADTALIPAFQAMRVAGGKDFISPRPNVPWMTMKFVMLTKLQPGFKAGKEVFPLHAGTYDHNIYARAGLSGSGHFAQGFGAVTAAERPALLWLYERMFAEADRAAARPFDTASPYPHRAILAFVNWPFGESARTPGEILPRAVEDRRAAHYMFRNRWQDANDIVVDALLQGSRGHYSVSGGKVLVWGLGEKTQFPVLVTGAPKRFAAGPAGGMVQTAAGCLGVDFSGASGADAVIVLSGPVAGTVRPYAKGKVAVCQVRTVSGLGYVIMTLSASGGHPSAEADGEALRLGRQRIRAKPDGLVFEPADALDSM